MDWNYIARFLVSMIVMMNPLGSVSLFIDLTRRLSLIEKRRIAISTTIAMIVICLVTIWVGEKLLLLFGITINSFRFAGGVILFLMGLSMLRSEEKTVSASDASEVANKKDSIAIVPLALPIIIGPGAISTLIITVHDYSMLVKSYISTLSIILCLGMGTLLYFANVIIKVVGKSGINVVTRIMGLILTALAAGMLADAICGLIPILNK